MLKDRLQRVTNSPFQAQAYWLDLWGIVMLALITLAFSGIAFKWWVVIAFASFLPMELIGLFASGGGKRPPLTDVIRSYVPAWVALPLMLGLLGAAGGAWGVRWSRPVSLFAWVAVSAWILLHFWSRYNQPASD